MLKLLTNWCPPPLHRALKNEGVEAHVMPKKFIIDLPTQRISEYDVLYYARFVPPLLDKSTLTGFIKTDIPIVVGAHAPLTIDYPVRPTHILYDLVYPLQIFLYSRRLRAIIHVLNTDDFKHCERLGIKAVYVPLGIDVDMFRPRKKDEVFTVIYPGRASWNKGTDIFVAIAHTLAKELGNRIRFIIISYGFLTKLYEKIRHYPNVEILPWLSPQEYAKVLAESHVLLFPSRYESFGLVVLEALVAGVPTVAFNVRGAVRDIMLRNNVLRKYVVCYRNINAFIRCIIGLLNLWYKKPESYLDLATKCRKVAERYSWDIIAKKFGQAIRKVAHAKYGQKLK